MLKLYKYFKYIITILRYACQIELPYSLSNPWQQNDLNFKTEFTLIHDIFVFF